MYKEIITWLTADIWNTYCDCSSTKTLWESIQQAAEGWQFKEQAIFLKIQICAFFFSSHRFLLQVPDPYFLGCYEDKYIYKFTRCFDILMYKDHETFSVTSLELKLVLNFLS